MNSIPRRYVLLQIDDTNELVILEIKNVKYVSEFLEKCVIKQQLAAFGRVEAFWKGCEIFGSPLFVSVDDFECEKERFRLLRERRVAMSSKMSSGREESFHEKSFSPDSDSIGRAKKMLLYSDILRDDESENFVKLWAYVLENEDKQKALYVRNTVNQAFESEFIIVGDLYNVNRLAVARGLSERNTIESYFRHLIRETWPKEEYVNRTVTGKNGKLAVDKTRLSAFINYAIVSWNEYHGKNPSPKDLVIKKNDIHQCQNKLRSVCSQFCSDATKRSRSISPPTTTT